MAEIDLGEQVVRLRTQRETVELPLEPELRKHRKQYSEKDSEDFTSSSEAIPSSSSQDNSENEDLVLCILHTPSFNLNLQGNDTKAHLQALHLHSKLFHFL